MDGANISPSSIASEFLQCYYGVLHKSPKELYRFYEKESSYLHGQEGELSSSVLVGTKAIQAAVAEENLLNMSIVISTYHAQFSGQGVLIQVIGVMSNETSARKFCQTFSLVRQESKESNKLIYHIQNDIFCFLNDATYAPPTTSSDVEEVVAEPVSEPVSHAPVAEPVLSQQAPLPTPVVNNHPAPTTTNSTPAPNTTTTSAPTPTTTTTAAPVEATTPAPVPTPTPTPKPLAAPQQKAIPNGHAVAPGEKFSYSKAVAKDKVVVPTSQPTPAPQTAPIPQTAPVPKEKEAPREERKEREPRDRTNAAKDRPPSEKCTIFITNIPQRAQKHELLAIFSEFGKVFGAPQRGVAIFPSKTDTTSQNAFIDFEDEASALRALAPERKNSFTLHGQTLIVEGRPSKSGGPGRKNGSAPPPRGGGSGGRGRRGGKEHGEPSSSA